MKTRIVLTLFVLFIKSLAVYSESAVQDATAEVAPATAAVVVEATATIPAATEILPDVTNTVPPVAPIAPVAPAEPVAPATTEVKTVPSEFMQLEERFGDRFRSKRTDRVAVGDHLVIARDEAVADVACTMGHVEVYGMAKDVVCVMGHIEIGPEAIIEGDVTAVMGNIDIHEGAIVKGDAVSVMGSVNDPGWAVKGDRITTPGLGGISPGEWEHFWPIAVFLGVIATVLKFLARLLLALLIVALMPLALERMIDQMRRNPFISGIAGAGSLVVFPILVLLLVISMIGVLFIPVLVIVYWVLYLVGMTAISQWLGHLIRARAGRNGNRPYLDVTIGVVFLTLLALIPWLGFAVKCILALGGMGAVLLTRFGSREGYINAH